MKKAEKELLVGFLGKTLNMPSDKVESLFTQEDPKSDEFDFAADADKTLIAADAERVKAFKEKETKEFQSGYKKAKAEVLTDFEKQISEKFDVKSDKLGLELIEEIVTSKTKAPEIEADKVKVHPEYLNLEKSLNAKLKETEKTWEKKFADREAELAKAQVFSKITKKAEEQLQKLNPILPSDQTKANNQKSLLFKDLKDYQFTENGDELVISDKDGKRLEDDHGKPITFEALIKKHAEGYWDFKEGEDRSGSGADNDAAAKAKAAAAAGKKWTGKVPANDMEFQQEFAKLAGAENAESRIALMEIYEASQKATV